jgi:hypothetical protein
LILSFQSTIHNLNLRGLNNSLKEISRVSKGNSFINVNGYKNLKEKKRLDKCNVVANTILSETKWKEIFKKTSFKGDCDFFKI